MNHQFRFVLSFVMALALHFAMIYQVGSIRFGIQKTGQKKNDSRVTIRVREKRPPQKKAKGKADELGNAKPKSQKAAPKVSQKRSEKKQKNPKKTPKPKAIAKKRIPKKPKKPTSPPRNKVPRAAEHIKSLSTQERTPKKQSGREEAAVEEFDFSTDAVQRALISKGREDVTLTHPPSSELIEEARDYGKIVGKGAKVSDSSSTSFGSPDDGATVYSGDFAAYYNGVKRQFSRKWGGVRLLYGGFVGIPGEMIDYEILLDRGGNVIKIVNGSAKRKKNRHRDFSAVDELVEAVFSDMQAKPVPDYIRDVPFIIGISIYYQGTRIFMQYN